LLAKEAFFFNPCLWFCEAFLLILIKIIIKTRHEQRLKNKITRKQRRGKGKKTKMLGPRRGAGGQGKISLKKKKKRMPALVLRTRSRGRSLARGKRGGFFSSR
jgi:hypothetical protein